VVRTERRRNARTGASYPCIVASTAMVGHVYFYCVDEDFGPFFLNFCTYFPYYVKLCLNGHEYLKCPLRKRGIAFEARDNGVRWCEDPASCSVASSYSRCHRQLAEFAAVRLPAETVECCSPVNAFATDFSWRLAT
jgi:hypothetical protein